MSVLLVLSVCAVMPPVVAQEPVLSDGALMEYGRAVATAIQRGDRVRFGERMDFKRMFRRALPPLAGLSEAASAERSQILDAADGAADQTLDALHRAVVEREGTAVAIGPVRDAVGQGVSVRLHYAKPSDAFNPLVLYVDPPRKRYFWDDRPPTPRAWDFRMGTRDALYSQERRRVFLTMLHEADPAFAESLPAHERLRVESAETLAKIETAIAAGEPAEATRLFDTLPEAVRRDQRGRRLRVRATRGLPEIHAAAVAEYAEHRRGPGGDLLLAESHRGLGDHAAAAAVFAAMDRHVGGDPYLQDMRAVALARAGRFAEAERAVADILSRCRDSPKLAPVDPERLHRSALDWSVRGELHACTLHWLEALDEDFGPLWLDPATTADYAAFVASPQHAQWLAHREANPLRVGPPNPMDAPALAMTEPDGRLAGPPSETAMDAFAAAFLERLRRGDAAGVGELFDYDGLLSRVADGRRLPNWRRFRDSYRDGNPLGQSWVALQQKRPFHDLGTVDDAVGRARLFRVADTADSAGGVNYIKIYLSASTPGTARIVDVYAFDNGEPLTTTLRRVMLPSLVEIAADTAGIDESAHETETELVDAGLAVSPVVDLLREGRFAEAEALLDELPEPARSKPLFLRMRIQTASGTDVARHVKLVDEYRRRYPDDPALPLVEIDAHCARGDLPASLRGVDRLDRVVGGDPYLATVAAGLLAEMDQPDQALARIENALAAHADSPRLDTGTRRRLTLQGLELHLVAQDHGRTLAWLKRADEAHDGGLKADLSGIEAYRAFVAGPQYAQWQEYAAARDRRQAETPDPQTSPDGKACGAAESSEPFDR